MKLNNKTRPKDNQDAFNRVYERVITYIDVQRCMSKGGGCQYRRGKNACAIGYMMPDKIAKMADSGNTDDVSSNWGYIEDVIKNIKVAEIWFENVSLSLLNELQKIHDQSYYCSKIDYKYLDEPSTLKELKRIARAYKLKMPEKNPDNNRKK